MTYRPDTWIYISALYWKFLFSGVPMFDNTLQIRTGFALVHFYHMSLYTGLCPMCKPIWIKSGRALTSSISAGAEALGTNRKRPPPNIAGWTYGCSWYFPGNFDFSLIQNQLNAFVYNSLSILMNIPNIHVFYQKNNNVKNFFWVFCLKTFF